MAVKDVAGESGAHVPFAVDPSGVHENVEAGRGDGGNEEGGGGSDVEDVCHCHLRLRHHHHNADSHHHSHDHAVAFEVEQVPRDACTAEDSLSHTHSRLTLSPFLLPAHQET